MTQALRLNYPNTDMQILDLPNELLQGILISSIHARTLKRGLRLRLPTPERINENLVPALYASRALERYTAREVGTRSLWRVRHDCHGAKKLWHDYLVHRAMGETDPGAGWFVEIRQTAEALWAATRTSSSSSSDGDHPSQSRPRNTVRDIVDGLCWLVLESRTPSPGERQHPGPRVETNAAANMLCAAAYFNELPVAATLLGRGECTPSRDTDLFPPPIDIAAFRGHAEMLDLFQNHIWVVAEATGGKSSMPHDLDEEWIRWSVERWPGAIRGALLADDLPMLQRAIFPPTLSDYPPPLLSRRFAFAETGDASPVSNLTALQWSAQSPAMWDYIMQLGAAPSSDTQQMDTEWIRRGNLTMLRHYRTRIAAIHRSPPQVVPLDPACRLGHEDIVDYLLEEHACHGEQSGTQRYALSLITARAGSVRIMAKLIDYGILSPEQGRLKNLLAEVVRGEDLAMLKMLLRKGYVFTEQDRQYAATMASKWGLESMVDHLKS
ncbi:hypothetical protein PG991_013846 [Apiospora marii]|uniref:F-box domain-containing protein n=1 Tax=Apiospora marii TaxID=335849 RepID=A0ABR1R7A5_9PEZI